MDVQSIRRAAPLIFGAVVVLTLFLARDAFVVVAIVGGVLLGLLHALTGRSVQRQGGGRDRQRRRDRR